MFVRTQILFLLVFFFINSTENMIGRMLTQIINFGSEISQIPVAVAWLVESLSSNPAARDWVRVLCVAFSVASSGDPDILLPTDFRDVRPCIPI